VFGLSSQSTEYQREARDRLQLPFELLSDGPLRMKEALRLPTFVVQDIELYKRLTLIIEDATIKKVFYPVFPPDKNVEEVLTWLSSKAK
jgi:peroxiredoxin